MQLLSNFYFQKINSFLNLIKKLLCYKVVVIKKRILMKKINYSYDYWTKRNWYYHTYLAKLYQYFIPSGVSILNVGYNSILLDAIKPKHGGTIEPKKLKKTPQQNTNLPSQPYDYLILSSTIHEVDDVQDLFESLKPFCSAQTKIVIDFYSFLWEPILWITKKLRLSRPIPLKNWISSYDLKNFMHLAGFDVITHHRKLLVPIYIPFISWFFNTFIANLPLINKLCLVEILIARPLPEKGTPQNLTVSIIIPCKNERGNIEPAVLRCPPMGTKTEIIFIEGNSKDGTAQEIERIIKKYPEKNVKFFKQDGKGKGDAVRKGFEKATGDILMIQDADLTAPPEELPKFYHALIEGKGEFINGSRLVYGMETEAMRFLNMIANHSFALSFSWLLGQRLKDTLCGTKVLLKKDYEKIAANRYFFGEFDPFGDFDLLFGAAKLNLKIIDLPVHYKQRTYGSTQIRRFYHGLLLAKMSVIGLKKFKLY
jgi:hypothetical protein